MNDDVVVFLSVERLAELCNPYDVDVWGEFTVSREHVLHCLSENIVSPLPYSDQGFPIGMLGRDADYHASRIAYLMKHGWLDAIHIDVGVPEMGRYVDWLIEDGNHRLCAAILRGDSLIQATVSGSMTFAEELLHFKYPELIPTP